MNSNFIKKIINKSQQIRIKILKTPRISAEIDPYLTNNPKPYIADGKIKLIIIGQDPTVRQVETRKNIKTVLNLDYENVLHKYIKDICKNLDLDIKKNIYGTNLYKCFFKFPPADDIRILEKHFRIWFNLLIEEIDQFPDSIIISLGEPLIKQLIFRESKELKFYWGYYSNHKYKHIVSKNNFLQRNIFPFPHLPSYLRKKFYRINFTNYCKYVKNHLDELDK